MNFDENGYARYKNGDVAILARPEHYSAHWVEEFDELDGKQVHIRVEHEDSEGYYYSIREARYKVDISLLRPVNSFELYNDEEIGDVDVSDFLKSYAVGA